MHRSDGQFNTKVRHDLHYQQQHQLLSVCLAWFGITQYTVVHWKVMESLPVRQQMGISSDLELLLYNGYRKEL